MKILMLGGTRFFGRLLLRRLLDDGHALTLVSRKKIDIMPASSLQIAGEREAGATLAAIAAAGPYDAVIDNIAYQPRQMEPLLDILAGQEEKPLYILTSTSAVYLDRFLEGPLAEEDEAVVRAKEEIAPAFPAAVVPYALGKIGCEIFLRGSGLPFLVLRLPFVTGAGDFSCRLAWYLHRLRQGEIILPTRAACLQQVWAGDLAAVYAEAVARRHEMAGEIVNVTPAALDIRSFVDILADESGRQYVIRRVDDATWAAMAGDFPYIYNQVLRHERYDRLFRARLTPMADFLPDTVLWYLANPKNWQGKFLPAGMEAQSERSRV